MKFLCVECDEPMALQGTRGPDEGSMTLIFGCPSCGKQTAMLTNAMETQMVRALDVKIGGRNAPAAPMETMRGALAQQREDMVVTEATPQAAPQPEPSGSRCPFSGVVAEAFEQQQPATGPTWTADAEARIERVPTYIRSMIKKGVEDYASEQGYAEITPAVMDEVKGRFGMV